MKRTTIARGIIAATALLLATLVFVAPRIILGMACDREGDRRALDAEADFVCAHDNKIVYEAWSECGLVKVCVNPNNSSKDGSSFTAQGGHLRTKAKYENGTRIEAVDVSTGTELDR